MKKRLYIIFALLAAVIVYGSFDPSKYKIFPKCPFLLITGWKCPGCGSQRAIHSLLHLDLMQAWSYNAFLVVAIPLIILLYVAEIRRKRHPQMYMWLNSKWMIWSVFIIICGWWLVRNLV